MTPASELPEWLLGWARTDGAGAVLTRARFQIERATGTANWAAIQVALTDAQRHDVGRLLGLPWQRSGNTVKMGPLRAALCVHGVELETLLEHLNGPLRDLKAAKAAQRAAAQAEGDAARAALTASGVPDPVADILMARRWLSTGPARVDLAQQVATVLDNLTATKADCGEHLVERPLLATLASDLFADPHALDRTQLLGRAVARTLAALDAHARALPLVEVAAAAGRACGDAATWRAVWARAEVACDLVSSTVLVLNLTVHRTGAAAVMMRAAAEHGEPIWVTARSLEQSTTMEVTDLTGVTVRVCENPAIVEAAATRFGSGCPPLVCLYGRPSAAAWLLLEAVTGAGAHLLVTGDRDQAGQSITGAVLTRFPTALPWLAHVDGTYEEERLTALLDDLNPAGSGTSSPPPPQ